MRVAIEIADAFVRMARALADVDQPLSWAITKNTAAIGSNPQRAIQILIKRVHGLVVPRVGKPQRLEMETVERGQASGGGQQQVPVRLLTNHAYIIFREPVFHLPVRLLILGQPEFRVLCTHGQSDEGRGHHDKRPQGHCRTLSSPATGPQGWGLKLHDLRDFTKSPQMRADVKRNELCTAVRRNGTRFRYGTWLVPCPGVGVSEPGRSEKTVQR